MQPPFHLPSLAVACLDSDDHWPKRISPGNLATPEPCQFHLGDQHQVTLGTKTAVQLGDLLLKLIEWTLVPHIDLTREQPEMGFQPPDDTTVLLSGSKLPAKVIFLVAESTAYSVYVYSSLSMKAIQSIYIMIHSQVVKVLVRAHAELLFRRQSGLQSAPEATGRQ